MSDTVKINTAGLIAHATHDEDFGEGYGGVTGSQTGTELQLKQWEASSGYEYLYRVKTTVADYEEKREQIAVFMEKAVSNGYIGYDNNRNARETLYNELNRNGYAVDKVNVSVECDCSALVYCAIRPVTGVDFTPLSKEEQEQYKCINIPKVSIYDRYIEGQCAGMFEKITIDTNLDPYTDLRRGDIIVQPGKHIAVWV